MDCVSCLLSSLQAYDSPLAVTLAAGSVVLPALLKLAGLMEKGGKSLHRSHPILTVVH
jgi:hypothetical protein